MVISEVSFGSVIFAAGESLFFAIIACAIALKITELLVGNSDNRFFYGFILIMNGVVLNLLAIIAFFTLSPLSLMSLGVDLFEYLASSVYRDFMVILSVSFQLLFTVGLTFSRKY